MVGIDHHYDMLEKVLFYCDENADDDVTKAMNKLPPLNKLCQVAYLPGSLDKELQELRASFLTMRKMNDDYERMETSMLGPLDFDDSGYSTDVMGPYPDATEWLQSNYEEEEGISVPRSVMYGHYTDYCHEHDVEPMNQASFGKLIRAVFPNIKTRRLGNRGQSKYHYYGIKVRDTSAYRNVMGTAQRIKSSPSKSPNVGRTMPCVDISDTSLPVTPVASHTNFSMPEFPNVNDLRLAAQLKERAGVFLMMYRHHSQRIVDTVLRANFSDVQGYISHFWTTLPSHISSVLYHDRVIKVIRLCDTIMYTSITNLLIPGVLHSLPASLLQAIRAFSRNYITWLEEALIPQNVELKKQKLQAAKEFSRNLTRLTEISHMASVARSVLHNSESVKRLRKDWKKLDKENIAKQCTWLLMDENEGDGCRVILKCLNDFERMMEHQTAIEQYIEWVRNLATRFIEKKSGQISYKVKAREFLLKWSYISNIVIKELTMRSAETFGSYHLLSMLFKDYVIHNIDQKLKDEADKLLQQQLYTDYPAFEHQYVAQQPNQLFTPSSTCSTFPQPNTHGLDVTDGMDMKPADQSESMNALPSTSLPSIYEMFSLPQACTDVVNPMTANCQQTPQYDLEKHTGRYYPQQQTTYQQPATYKYYCNTDGSSLTLL